MATEEIMWFQALKKIVGTGTEISIKSKSKCWFNNWLLSLFILVFHYFSIVLLIIFINYNLCILYVQKIRDLIKKLLIIYKLLLTVYTVYMKPYRSQLLKLLACWIRAWRNLCQTWVRLKHSTTCLLVL